MATTSLWSIRGNVSRVINYIKNPAKTTLPVSQIPPEIEHGERIETVQVLVDAINCSVKNAAKDMNSLKEYFGKPGGITAYHGYQSFSPEDELTPMQAHEIGMELADRLWGDKYQVLVATHLDKQNHIHNHFVINTVPLDGGRKFCRTKQDYLDMRNESDELCRTLGLSVCKVTGKGKSYGEYKAELEGKPTIRFTIRWDIDRAIADASCMNRFYENMEKLGYKVILYGQSGKALEHPKLMPYGTQKCFRFDKLGEGYDIPDIHARLLDRGKPYCRLFPPAPKRIRQYSRYHEPRTVCATYRYYGRFIRLQFTKPGYVRRIPYSLREDIAKLEHFIDMQNFTSRHKFQSVGQVKSLKEYLEVQICSLSKQRRNLNIRASHEEKLGHDNLASALRYEAKENYGKQIKEMRRELKLCTELLSEFTAVRDKCSDLRNEITLERNELIRQRQRVRVR